MAAYLRAARIWKIGSLAPAKKQVHNFLLCRYKSSKSAKVQRLVDNGDVVRLLEKTWKTVYYKLVTLALCGVVASVLYYAKNVNLLWKSGGIESKTQSTGQLYGTKTLFGDLEAQRHILWFNLSIWLMYLRRRFLLIVRRTIQHVVTLLFL